MNYMMMHKGGDSTQARSFPAADAKASALLAIETAVDAIHESGTELSRNALDQIGHLGFDTRPTEERKPKTSAKPKEPWASKTRRTRQPTLFQK